MNIFYSWPNASARVIEKEVTTKLEGFFNSVKGIKGLNSVTTKGSGRISLSFKKGSNLDVLRFEVAMLIRRVYPDLPEQVSYPVLSLGTGGQKTSPLLTYTVNASANPYYIQKYTEDNIATKISGIKGLNEVKVYGATPFEWEIQFNTNAIDNLGLSVNEISTAINNYFKEEIIGVGTSQPEGKQYPNNIRLSLGYDTPDELNWKQIPIKKSKDRIIRLGDNCKRFVQRRNARLLFPHKRLKHH